MEYQKIANLLERTSDNPSKFRTRNWFETNHESRGNQEEMMQMATLSLRLQC